MPCCTKCGNDKPESAFTIRNKKLGVRHRTCMVCMRAYRNAHYARNKPSYIEKSKKNKKTAKQAAYVFLVEYRKTHPCVDCGEADHVVLDFDHKNPSEKTACISRMAADGFSLDKIKKEMEKCDVRCANCHRRKTYRDLRYFEGYDL